VKLSAFFRVSGEAFPYADTAPQVSLERERERGVEAPYCTASWCGYP
jgi:hypothetical protein